ncbi:MAG: hypothetical protein LBS65_02185 [Desulfovibrio sp.]|nr:hypothetical protein [Desulfovibrio sp.]
MKQFAYGGQSPPAPVSRQGFAHKSLPSSLLVSFVNCSIESEFAVAIFCHAMPQRGKIVKIANRPEIENIDCTAFSLRAKPANRAINT